MIDKTSLRKLNRPACRHKWLRKHNMMKTLSTMVGLLVVLVMAGCASASKSTATASLSVKTGDALYVCACGTCDCNVVALKPGKCGCGHDLVKVTVTEVKDQVACYEIEGKTRTAKLPAKYKCACGSSCCQMISDKPGKCSCGTALVKVGK